MKGSKVSEIHWQIAHVGRRTLQKTRERERSTLVCVAHFCP